MKIGFIGAGSMGSLLIGAFLRAGAMLPEHITVSSRTSSKVTALAQRFPGLRQAASNTETASEADLLFLCVKPPDFRSVLSEIAAELSPGQIVISITSPVTIEQLETILPSKIAKIIPSVVNAVGAGASLCMWGSRLDAEDKHRLVELFSTISRPVEIREEKIRAAADLSSCGPAFFAYLLGQFVEAAVLTAGMDRDTANTLASEMLLGTARLLTEHGLSTLQLQEKVSVPGGITAAALEVLRDCMGDVFQKVLRVTHDKFAEDVERVENSLFHP